MRRWLPTIGFLGFVALIIFLADEGVANGFFQWIQHTGGGDKLGHFVLIGGLAGFLNYSLRCREWRGWLIGSLIVVLLCTLEEVSQRYLATRHFDWGDLTADYLGIWAFGALARRVCRRTEV